MQTSNQIPSQLSLLLPKSSNIKIVDSITGQRSLLGNDERDIIETDTEKMYYGVQNNYKWGVLLKSHGDSRFIDDLDDEVDWAQVMQESDFCIKLDEILCDLSHRENYFNSGAAIIMMKAFNNCIQIVSIGDCGALIFKNKKLIYKSKFHTTENTDELERLKEELGDTCSIINSAKPLPKIRSSTTYQAKKMKLCNFKFHKNRDVQLFMTQAIGHNNKTGYFPEIHVEHFTNNDEIKCILGTEGFFQMILLEDEVVNISKYTTNLSLQEKKDIHQDMEDLINMSAIELIEKTEKRWKQRWSYMYDLLDITKRTDNISFSNYNNPTIIVYNKMPN